MGRVCGWWPYFSGCNTNPPGKPLKPSLREPTAEDLEGTPLAFQNRGAVMVP